jgi:hypothetical protein
MLYRIQLFASLSLSVSFAAWGEHHHVQPKTTLTVLEVDAGDRISYTLQNGRAVEMELLGSSTELLFTTLDTLKRGSWGNASIYSMSCTMRIDGQPLEMVRYVPVKQSFYEPWVVNGLRIWFDGLRSVSQYFNENHGNCLPHREARFAFQDASFPICPEPLSNWCALPEQRLRVSEAYRGEDTWMGTYYGADLHGGLDINMPSNSPLWAPVGFDDHYFFNTLAAGHNNNRWRGIKTWDNGDTWQLQTHHLTQLVIPEHQPVRKGKLYAYTAGVLAGYTSHTHFVFRVQQPGHPMYYMDPWVIFWQIFEQNKQTAGEIHAQMAPLAAASAGEIVQFSAAGSRGGITGNDLRYRWDFGDGYTAIGERPQHVFLTPGMYPVTLVVNDGVQSDVYRQHISVNGKAGLLPHFRLLCPGNPSFDPVPAWKMFADGSVPEEKNLVRFHGYKGQEADFLPEEIIFVGEGLSFGPPGGREHRVEVLYTHGRDWLEMQRSNRGDSLTIALQPQPDRMIQNEGYYEAWLLVHHDEAVNSPQYVRIHVDFKKPNTAQEIIVDDSDEECRRSEFFWLRPEFHYDWAAGHNGHYLIGRNNRAGEWIRYMPNLKAGTWRVELAGPAYADPVVGPKLGRFYVIVKHRNGEEQVLMEPARSLVVGEFFFAQGREHYVEIRSGNSEGLILADAIRFVKVE